MGDENGKPSVSVDVDVGAKLEAKTEVPSHASGRAVHALLDAISPFTDGLGLVGDHIRAHRFEVAVRIAERAKQIADERNLKIQSPPLKFMLPFLEKSSLEEPDSSLNEVWSQLLVSAASKFQPSMTIFPSILSQIGPSEANLLRELTSGFVEDRQVYSREHLFVEQVEGLLSEIRRRIIAGGEVWFSGAAELLEWRFESPRRPLEIRYYHKLAGNTGSVSRNNDFWEFKKIVSCGILERQGLVRTKSYTTEFELYGAELTLLEVTPFGLEFAYACEGIVGDSDP
ncbi:MAG: DUF4393 domain-containing protein [Sphingomonadales bacterium]|nr:DUF4393 domain-containing protein [Sphingomonadales bacterium]